MDLTQADLARLAGISRTALSRIENERWRPSAKTVQALEASLDPFDDLHFFRHGGGPMAAAEFVRDLGAQWGFPYALTLDVAAWVLCRYQTPGAAWVYVRPLEKWAESLRRRGVRRPGPGERADLILLRAPDEALDAAHVAGGLRLVSTRRLLQDCARLRGRHALDAARVYLAYPEARTPGLRLDADALIKVFEEVSERT